MTDQLDLDGLERLAKAATQGPWQNGIEDLEGIVAPHNPGLGNVICLPPKRNMYSSLECWSDNAAYIAAANPATILALISQAREAERMRGALERIMKVEVYGHDNIWAGSHRCKDIARQALAPATGGGK